jgi:glycerate dehydrogenase
VLAHRSEKDLHIAREKKFSNAGNMTQSVKHNIVALDSWVKPPPFDIDHELHLHNTTDPEEIKALVKDATMIIISMVPVSRAAIEAAPNLQLIACNGTGTDHVDKVAAREHGVAVCHVPAQNTESVSEHAFALFFSLRRQILPMHTLTIDGSTWAKNNAIYQKMGPPPRTNGEETLVLVGYGAIGASS